MRFIGHKWGENWIISGFEWKRFSKTLIPRPFQERFLLFCRCIQAGCRTNFQSEAMTERRPLINVKIHHWKMAVSVFKKKLTRRGGLRTSGVHRSTSIMEIAGFSVQNGVSSQIRPVLDQYFRIFQGFFLHWAEKRTKMAVPRGLMKRQQTSLSQTQYFVLGGGGKYYNKSFPPAFTHAHTQRKTYQSFT